MAAALAATADDEALEEAVDRLLQDRYAPNTHRVRATWQRTWMKMHVAAHRRMSPPPSPFPLTPDIIHRVAAMFKAGKYLSFENYMMWAKSEHIAVSASAPATWTIELSTAMNDAIRSCDRGAGISRQSHPTLQSLAASSCSAKPRHRPR